MKDSQYHYFILLIFKPNFITTNVFLLHFCCVLRFSLSHSVLFGLFCPPLSYSVHFGFIRWTSFHFYPIESIRSFSVHIGPIWSNSTMSNLVLFGPHWSYSFHSIHIGSLCSNSVHFGLIWSNSVYFDSIWSYPIHIGISFIYPYFHFHVSLRAANVCTWYKIPA